MRIFYSPTFVRRYKKLSPEIKLLAERMEIVFKKNPRSPILHTHKLHGGLKNFWAFSINSVFRIVFEFASDKSVTFHFVGDHDEVY